ncbi:MAG TPA: hypothetical protein VKA76_15620 [Gammaproteobacteria bacterium]|nr:hypothetical protein [Gammaproteobacteria bacterium]
MTKQVAGWVLAAAVWAGGGTCLADGSNAPGGDDVFAAMAAVEGPELAQFQAREGHTTITVESRQDLAATINGSSFEAGSINSGSVTIGPNALDHFGGVGLFNIVTGNNNAVDAAIGVTFNLQ